MLPATVTNPIPLSATPIRYERSAPLLGEHNDAILRERLGLTAEQIAQLQVKGVSLCRARRFH